MAFTFGISPFSVNAETISCEISFNVTAGNNHGTIIPGDQLQGIVKFTTKSTWQQDVETASYFSSGEFIVKHPDHGQVKSEVRVVHVVRTPYIADYISIDAHLAEGNLGGQTRYEDPMLLTFYAKPGTLSSSRLPRDTAAWNQLSKRQVFQVHTPDAMSTFYGDFETIKGDCG